jgi:HPt (histidine-containing phosphotransfer) domain-containing protein
MVKDAIKQARIWHDNQIEDALIHLKLVKNLIDDSNTSMYSKQELQKLEDWLNDLTKHLSENGNDGETK